ncbi:unnamed protein product [Clonostachys rosea f. rosea IK726]|uniref:Uncharacterized protein n=1 Tax=Clonostachys rosea f. rosea IK726 TaxID=1349383 RepID=A0ACA9UBQ4_BIOOC|nr:unnamed protein product [Clonostachys rosea f. rosea IK726]
MPNCNNLRKCAGHCVWNKEFKSCGGFVINTKKCPKGYECKADLRDSVLCYLNPAVERSSMKESRTPNIIVSAF